MFNNCNIEIQLLTHWLNLWLHRQLQGASLVADTTNKHYHQHNEYDEEEQPHGNDDDSLNWYLQFD